MKNITIDSPAVAEPDAHGMYGALNVAADCDVLGHDVALDLGASAYEKIRCAQLAFDSAEDLRWTIAFEVANNRHARANARAHPRLRCWLRLLCALFNAEALLYPLGNQECPRCRKDRNKCKPTDKQG